MFVMAMLRLVMLKTPMTRTSFYATASTTLAARHVIAVAPASTSFHGNQLLLTVPMNVKHVTAIDTHRRATTNQR